uniref:D-isomer specific 2-hydroxyacid dehydrogenase NAD-binding domain-containing protein n=2 Tax=Guillardia theta TaxID=55529 RepID=A0A6U6BIL7_GUITH|mmetsp:Transcript_38585/g.121577  ORF Transcript_38585/g.121577 Transcript_38585/m.121577 type:complete len:262 (+) Transcript_38585:184-969(+)
MSSKLVVCNLHHNAPMTAELAVALCLAASKQIFEADRKLRQHDWSSRGIPCEGVPDPLPMLLLQGKVALVVGYGEVGQRVARIMSAFGMEVLATRASLSRVARDKHAVVHPPADLLSLLPRANVVFLCVPLTSGTSKMLGRKELAMLPKGSVLVNVSRGEVVDEDALFEALSQRENLFAAGIDTWYNYPATSKDTQSTPVSTRNDFSKLTNLVMSPHRGGAVGLEETESARLSAIAEALNLAADRSDVRAMPCRVDVERGY